jgi:hypothetical protein
VRRVTKTIGPSIARPPRLREAIASSQVSEASIAAMDVRTRAGNIAAMDARRCAENIVAKVGRVLVVLRGRRTREVALAIGENSLREAHPLAKCMRAGTRTAAADPGTAKHRRLVAEPVHAQGRGTPTCTTT